MVKFIIKWVMNGTILILLLQYFSMIPFWSAFIVSTVLSVISYLIGDQFVLRQFNNTAASLADGVLAIVYLYALEVIFRWGLSLGEIIFISAIFAIAEALFHRYIFQDTLGNTLE